MSEQTVVADVPEVAEWAEPAEVVKVEHVQPGDRLAFSDGVRLVVSSEHGCTILLALIQIIRFAGSDREHRWPWGDYVYRRTGYRDDPVELPKPEVNR